MHACPVWKVHGCSAPASARAGSASAKTRLGDLPPSSRSTRFMRGATASWMRAPTAELPVNEIMSISGASTSASPISGPWPPTKLSTPGGRTAPTIRQSAATPSGSAGAGFTTTVLPQARAGPIFPAQFVIGKLKGVMQATTPIGSRATRPCALPRGGQGLVGGGRGELGGAREAHRDRAHLLRLGDRADGARLGDGEIDQAGRLALEALRRLGEARGALRTAHGAPRAALEGGARGPRRGAHLLDRALRCVPGGLLGRRVDHRVRPSPGAHPLAADQDLVADGDAHAACALSAASRWRVVRCTGSVSNFGSTCLPKVSIDSSTYFWSRVRVKGA